MGKISKIKKWNLIVHGKSNFLRDLDYEKVFFIAKMWSVTCIPFCAPNKLIILHLDCHQFSLPIGNLVYWLVGSSSRRGGNGLNDV